MFFVNVQGIFSTKHVRGKILRNAWRFMNSYSVPYKNRPLDSYLRTNYGLGIRDCSIALLSTVNICRDFTGKVIITFKDKKSENLAKLITYGTGAISGSNILQLAFTI